jgi:hypothetical protein
MMRPGLVLVLASMVSAVRRKANADLAAESASAEGGAGSEEVWIRAECEIPPQVLATTAKSGTFSKAKDLKDLCFYLKGYEDQDVNSDESRSVKIQSILQGMTEGRHAEQDPADPAGNWRVKFMRMVPGEIEFDEFPETWEFELYGDVVDRNTSHGTHCKEPGNHGPESKDLIGALAITGEALKNAMKEQTYAKVHLKKIKSTSGSAKIEAAIHDVSQISCVFDFSAVGATDYMNSKKFKAKFNAFVSIDLTGSNTWYGPGEKAAMKGNVDYKRSKSLHHLGFHGSRNSQMLKETVADPTDWSDSANDLVKFNQYITPLKRVIKTISEFAEPNGVAFSEFGGNLAGDLPGTHDHYLRTDKSRKTNATLQMPENPNQWNDGGEGEMPFAYLRDHVPGVGDALAHNVVEKYINAITACEQVGSRGCWSGPTHVLPSIYWAVRDVMRQFKEDLKQSKDPVVSEVASTMSGDDLVLDGRRQTPEVKAHVKNEECKDHTYHILTLFTDGDWSMQEQRRTQEFIAKFASRLPISIILVGVGEGDKLDECEACVEEEHGYFVYTRDGRNNCICPSGSRESKITITNRQGQRLWQTQKQPYGGCSASDRNRMLVVEQAGGETNEAAQKDAHTDCSLFPMLEELDGDQGTAWYFLNWHSKQVPKRDIVQAVIMQDDEMGNAVKKISQKILEEVPDQMEDYFKNFCHDSPLGDNIEQELEQIEKLYRESMQEALLDWQKYEKIKQMANDRDVYLALHNGNVKDVDPKEFQQFSQQHGLQSPSGEYDAGKVSAEIAKAQSLDEDKLVSELDKLSNMLDMKGDQAEQRQEMANNADAGKEWTAGLTPPLLLPELDADKDMCPPGMTLHRDKTGSSGDFCLKSNGNDHDAHCILKACQETTIGVDLQELPHHASVRRGWYNDQTGLMVGEKLERIELEKHLLMVEAETGTAVRSNLERLQADAEKMIAAGKYKKPIGDEAYIVVRNVRCIKEGRSYKYDKEEALCKAPVVVEMDSAPAKEKTGSRGTSDVIIAGQEPYQGKRAGHGTTVDDDFLDLL